MKKLGIILLFSIPLFVIIVVVSVILLAINSQERKLQEEMGNPVILSDYQDWKEAEIDSNICVMIPAAWQMSRSNDQIFLFDSDGNKVAIGQKFVERTIERDNLFLESICGEKVLSNEPVHFSPYFYGNLATAWITNCTLESGKNIRFVSVKLPYHNQYIFRLCFFSENDETFYCDIAEAIAYSMRYQ